MNFIKSHFRFNKQERSGIFYLVVLLVGIQVGYFVYDHYRIAKAPLLIEDKLLQQKIDVLKQENLKKDPKKIYPFNPNFITDYKGYVLGMSAEEIDRLHAFRVKDKYVNSPDEFQKITLVSDSLLARIAPYFKFPSRKFNVWSANTKQRVKQKGNKKDISDLNLASAEELKEINGVGDKLSARIVKFRNRLGGFLVDEQLYDVYGLDSVVVQRVFQRFKVINAPQIHKISVTWASYKELRNVLYINDTFAKAIIEHRNKTNFKSLTDLKHLNGFPEGKLDRLVLYLEL